MVVCAGVLLEHVGHDAEWGTEGGLLEAFEHYPQIDPAARGDSIEES